MANTNETVRDVCAKCEVFSAYEREMAAKDAEIAKHERCYHALELHCKKLEDEYLKAMAALKPVMEICMSDETTFTQQQLMLAVAESQRIMKEGDAK